MRLWIMIISLTAFFGAFPKPNLAFHLPEVDDRVEVDHVRTKRGLSFSIGLGKEKVKPKVQITIMKPNFLTDLVMLKKGLLQKVIMTVVGLVGKLTAGKQMPSAAKTSAMPAPMTEKDSGRQTMSSSENNKQASSGSSGSNTVGQSPLTTLLQTTANQALTTAPTNAVPMTINVQTAGNMYPQGTGSQNQEAARAALLAAAEQLGQGVTGAVLRNLASTLSPATLSSNGQLNQNQNQNQRTSSINWNQGYQQQYNPYLQNMIPLSNNIGAGGPAGSWAIASHTPNGQMMMIMPSAASAHDPVGQAVLTMMLNQARQSSKPRPSSSPVFPANFPVHTSAPPVLAYAVTPRYTKYTPVFNSSWTFPSPRSLEDNTIETKSSRPSSTTPSTTIATILEIASRFLTSTSTSESSTSTNTTTEETTTTTTVPTSTSDPSITFNTTISSIEGQLIPTKNDTSKEP